jgi:membrane-bound lytic murein transglycosylase A
MRTVATVLLATSCCLLAGCPKKPPQTTFVEEEFDRPLPPGELALRKLTDPADMPDVTPACRSTFGLREAIAHSLNYLAKPSSRRHFPYGQITHHHAVESLKAFDAILAAEPSPQQMRDEIARKFDVYTSVGWDGSGTVLFTSYYTPIFRASVARTAEFRYPLYRPPVGLEKDPDGNVLGIRQPDGSHRRIPSRRVLETSGMLAGGELVWLADPFEVYIAHVQGSAILRLPDGRLATAGYTATNGHEYRSVAREMIADGVIDGKDISLGAMIAYFKAHPGQVNEYVYRNPRYVFFELGQGPPRGSLNEPVTPMRSIATDKAVYPRACLAVIVSPLPRRTCAGIELLPYTGFALDQDTGGAIRAPGRCDIYVGVGDKAGQLAGQTYNKGRLYYLFLKPAMVPAPALRPPGTGPGRSAPNETP